MSEKDSTALDEEELSGVVDGEFFCAVTDAVAAVNFKVLAEQPARDLETDYESNTLPSDLQ